MQWLLLEAALSLCDPRRRDKKPRPKISRASPTLSHLQTRYGEHGGKGAACALLPEEVSRRGGYGPTR